MNLRTRSLILVVLGLIVILSSSKSTQARNQGQSLKYPPAAVITSDITGSWTGYLTQPGGLFSFELSLTQNGSTIQGTSTIRTTGGHYGEMSLSGSISGSTVYLNEIQVIDSSPTPGFYWCIKTLNLTVSSFQPISTLAGNWQDPGCNSGIVQLQRSTDPFIQVGGSWLGTLTQSGTNFSFELDLTQNGSNITGTSTIRSGSGYGTMQLVGFLAGGSLFLHETSIIDSNRPNWCIKILNITYTNTGGVIDLNGIWSASGCTGGSLSLQKQLPAVTYTISGKVTDENGSALSGVTMSTNSGANTVTNASGVYTFTNLIANTYTLTPTKNSYHFTPKSQVVDVPPDRTNIDFKGITCSTDEWVGKYFNNRDLLGSPILNRCDQDIDFYWGAHSPDSSVPTDNFSVRWSRTIDIGTAGWYHFRAFTDDGLRLYVDGELIIDDWIARTFTETSKFKKLSQGPHQVVMEYVEWSSDAMAHLTWYRSLLCPDNAIDCSQNLTPMYQTSYLDTPMPSICTNFANQTVAAYGCTISSIAMALKAYGIDTNPQLLNEWLSSEDPKTKIIPRGYRDQFGQRGDPCSGFLVFDQIEEYAKTNGVNLQWQWSPDVRNVLTNNRLPVLMTVNSGSHYVLATDLIEVEDPNMGLVETFGIYDPHHAWTCIAQSASASPPQSQLLCGGVGSLEHATTQLEENQFYLEGGQTTSRAYLEYETGPQTPSMQFFINGVEVLLTDALGNRVGYDNNSGGFVQEIFNSAYFDAEIVPPGSNSNNNIERTLIVSENADGNYTLQVIAGIVGADVVNLETAIVFEIGIIGFDSEYNSLDTHLSGTLLPGEIAEYQINFVSGQELTITPVNSSNPNLYLPIILK